MLINLLDGDTFFKIHPPALLAAFVLSHLATGYLKVCSFKSIHLSSLQTFYINIYVLALAASCQLYEDVMFMIHAK